MVWIAAKFLLAQPSSLKPQTFPPAVSRSDVKIEYVVDVRNPSKKTLTISAQIKGLEPGEVTLESLNPKEDLQEIGKRISNLKLLMANGGVKTVGSRTNKFRFANDSDATVGISYQLKSDAIGNLGTSTYLDESRCLLSSSDTFLVPETRGATIKVSFLLPEKWKVVTLATPSVPTSYEVGGRRETFFYLGEAIGISERINNCAVSLAVEKDWPMSSRDTLRETRNQIVYLQNLAGDWEPRSLFIAFLNPQIAATKTEAVAIRKGDVIFLSPPQSRLNQTDDPGSLRFRLSEKLVGYFLPVARRSPEIPLQESLTTYLAMKTCLKTGGMSKTEFLEKMSRGLQEGLSIESDGTNPERGWKPRQSGFRQVLDFLVMDLALAFEGGQSGAMLGALQKSSPESRKTEEDSYKKLAEEGSLAQVVAGPSSYSGSDELAELLRPFGLVLERTEIPHLDFELSETFQVNRIERRTNSRRSNLQLGDRILAVNQNRLLEPVDLLKLRGLLHVAEDVTLTIERDGTILKLRERLEGISYCRLATNGLADSDKQQKLERFLAREVSN
jgi:M61 glycyl aminopeptidase